MRSRIPVLLLASLWLLPVLAGAAEEEPVEDAKGKHRQPSLEIGSVPYDDLGKALDGSKMLISDSRGKVVIISFWASWCGPCRAELPVLANLAKKVGPDDLRIIAINFQDERERFDAVAKILKDYPITLLRDSNHRAARTFKVQGIPRMIVIGRDGKVAADHTGYGEGMIPELVDQLNALLADKQQT